MVPRKNAFAFDKKEFKNPSKLNESEFSNRAFKKGRWDFLDAIIKTLVEIKQTERKYYSC
jgi:hypothetical protein